MRRAFQIASTGRPGPVLLSFPLNVLKARHEFASSEFEADECYGRFPAHRPVPPEHDIVSGRHASESGASDHPAGGGAIASGAMEEVRELAELLNVPVATTFMGKGVLSREPPSLPWPVRSAWATGDERLRVARGPRARAGDAVHQCGHRRLADPPQIRPNHPCRYRTHAGRASLSRDARSARDARDVLRAMLGMLNQAAVPDRTDVRDEVVALAARWRKESGIESAAARKESGFPVHPLQASARSATRWPPATH